MDKQLFSKINSVGAVRTSVATERTTGTNQSVTFKLICSRLDDPFTTYSYVENWSVKLQRRVHEGYADCEYAE